MEPRTPTKPTNKKDLSCQKVLVKPKSNEESIEKPKEPTIFTFNQQTSQSKQNLQSKIFEHKLTLALFQAFHRLNIGKVSQDKETRLEFRS